jgi:hypothetical protein
MHSHPAHLSAYDVLFLDGEDVRGLITTTRRAHLSRLIETRLAVFTHRSVAAGALQRLGGVLQRHGPNPSDHGAGADADAVEGHDAQTP